MTDIRIGFAPKTGRRRFVVMRQVVAVPTDERDSERDAYVRVTIGRWKYRRVHSKLARSLFAHSQGRR